MYKILQNYLIHTLAILFILLCSSATAKSKPELMLAKVFQPGVNVSEYWVSEKLDGVRARWNGQDLISRGGHVFKVPSWFTYNFPDSALDGELWMARRKFQKTISIVKKQTAHSGWETIKFIVFDLPDHQGDFSARVFAMNQLKKQNDARYLNFIPQLKFASEKDLLLHLNTITAQGGEGLMLHHENGIYRSGRSNDLIKLKPYRDAEAVVIEYRAGKGKYKGKMGAIKVRTAKGIEFFIGSGFTDKERDNPPEIGSMITFRYQGFTDNNIPRFAVFLRIYEDL